MVLSLNFELSVQSAHRPLYGLILDLQTVYTSLTHDDITALAGSAQSYLYFSRLTDAEFLYAPAQIALAACWMARIKRADGKTLSGADLVHTWLEAKTSKASKVRAEDAAQRDAMRGQHDALQTPAGAERASPQELASDEIQLAGFGMSMEDMKSLLQRIAALIGSVLAPSAQETDPPKPLLDMERVKSIDLRLRESLAMHEQAQHSRYVAVLTAALENAAPLTAKRRRSARASIPKTVIPSRASTITPVWPPSVRGGRRVPCCRLRASARMSSIGLQLARYVLV